MRRPLVLLCTAALGLGGLAGTLSPAAAAPPAPEAQAAPASAVPDELLVGYVRGASPSERGRARGRASAVLADRVVPAAADRVEVELVRLPQGKSRAQAEAELESDPSVVYAEPNWTYTHQATTSADEYFTDGRLWGLRSAATSPFGTAAADAWSAGSSGAATITIGIIDEGIQWSHPDLTGQVGNPGELGKRAGVDDDGNGLVDDVHGWDFAGNDSSVYDGGTKGNADDHGTHVAGTIGARTGNGGVVGVNHDVRLIGGKFLGARGGTTANAIKAVDYFTRLDALGTAITATNNSWGGGGYSQALADAVIRGANAGILFVAAAGNSATDNDATASYPSNYDTTVGTSTQAAASFDAVIAVAAIDSSGGLASFSQYGSRTVDLGAPGVGIWSTTAPGKIESYNGTSMATPHVTGAVALYAAAKGASADTIRTELLRTAVPTPSLSGKTVTGGRLNVANALKGVATPAPPPPAPGAATVSLSKRLVRNTTEVTVTWSGLLGSEVRVTQNSGSYTTANDGSHVETWTGSGTVTYTLCGTDGSPCATASIQI